MARLTSLRGRSTIRRVFGEGERYFGKTVTVYKASSAGPGARFALVAPRRIGGAVARNRTRRRIRAVISATASRPKAPVDVIVVAKGADVSFQELEQDLTRVLEKAGVMEQRDV